MNPAIRHIARLCVLCLLLVAGLWPAAWAGSYDAPLPPQLSTDPDLCAYAPCKEVLPGADSFSPRMGQPSYVEAYATHDGTKALLGYVFLSTDIVDIPAYSGKPVVTLIGMDKAGTITGVRILKHSEPILLVGIPESELLKFVHQFVGHFAGDKIEIGHARTEEGYFGIDAISGATVTVIAENQVVMRSAYEIAVQVGIIKAVARPPAVFTGVSERLGWDELVKEGSIGRLTVSAADLGEADTGQPYMDMYFADLNPPNIGRNLLGDDNYQRLMAQLKRDEQAIFIVGSGTASFKGSAFVRGGLFDRIQVTQDMDHFTFRDTDYLNLYSIVAAGAPDYRESGIFIIRNARFSAAYPWKLVLLANKRDTETGSKTFVNFDSEYWLPARYLVGGRPPVQRPEPTWLHIWKAKQLEVALFILLLAATATTYALRDTLVRRSTRKNTWWISGPRYVSWALSFGLVGMVGLAQPSITHVLTWFHSLLFHWRWELFLSDPLIFLFWIFIAVTVFVWGRGFFCGWLCPYGSMTGLIYKAVGATPLKRFQFELPMRWHNRLKWLKYAIFFVLLAVSFYSMGTAERMAEVEPFKSTFLVGGVWHRAWPFVTYWIALLLLSGLIERPFCKYLCPLGAGMAIPGSFRMIGLKRKAECTTCHACQKGCGSLAIDDQGRIDKRECLLCLECQVLYYDDHSCPPLSKERRRRQRANLPLTAISGKGYYIPIIEEKVVRPPSPSAPPAP